MSCLIVDDLMDGTVITQNFKIHRDTDIHVIRPRFYKHGVATTDITLKVYQDGIELASSIVTAAEINAAIPEAYFHGFIRFDFDSHINLHTAEGETKTEYYFTVEGVGGTDLAFISLVRQWEQHIYTVYQDGVELDEATNDLIEPYGFEIYEHKYT